MTARLRFTLLVPALTVAVYALVLALGDTSHTFTASFSNFWPLFMQMLSLSGCLIAATSFSRGDHLHTAWVLYCVGDVLLLIAAGSILTFPPAVALQVKVVATVLANIVAPCGSYLFARTWFIAGIELPGSMWTRRSGMLAGFAVGAVLGGPGVAHHLLEMANDGEISHLVGLFGTAGDIANLTFTVPIMLTALALRGGLISWVWTLMSASSLCWLAYDLIASLALPSLAGTVGGARTAALAFTCASGIAQRIIVPRFTSSERAGASV